MDQVKDSDDQRTSRGGGRRSSRRSGKTPEEEEANRDYIFEGIFFTIPTTCLFVVMDILVHRQFGETYGGGDIFRKVVKVFPGRVVSYLLFVPFVLTWAHSLWC